MLMISRLFKKFFLSISLRTALVVPFLFVGLGQFLCLVLLYYSPRNPVAHLMAPPIRKFAGVQYLKYPQNFELIEKAFPVISLWVVMSLGLFMTVYALSMLQSVLSNKPFHILAALKKSFKKFVPMFVVFVAIYFTIKFGSSFFVSLIMGFVKPFAFYGYIAVLLNIFLASFVQAMFLIIFPSMVMKNRSIIEAVKENFQFLPSFFTIGLGVVFFISLLNFIVIFLRMNLSVLIQKYGFEVVVGVNSVSILVNVLMDIMITLVSGLIYFDLMKKGQVDGK